MHLLVWPNDEESQHFSNTFLMIKQTFWYDMKRITSTTLTVKNITQLLKKQTLNKLWENLWFNIILFLLNHKLEKTISLSYCSSWCSWGQWGILQWFPWRVSPSRMSTSSTFRITFGQMLGIVVVLSWCVWSHLGDYLVTYGQKIGKTWRNHWQISM